MKCTYILIALAPLLSSASVLGAEYDNREMVVRHKRDFDIFIEARQRIVERLEYLRKAALNTLEDIDNYSRIVKRRFILFIRKVDRYLESLRLKIKKAILDFIAKIENAADAFRDCIERNRRNARALLKETLYKTMECAHDQIKRIAAIARELVQMARNAIHAANRALGDLNRCIAKINRYSGSYYGGDHGNGYYHYHRYYNYLGATACLGQVLIQSEIRGIAFVGQSTVLLAKLNIGLTILPPALEVCAGAGMVEAGTRIAQFVVSIGDCSMDAVVAIIN